MSVLGLPASWWPFIVIALAGWLPTGIWRYLGALSSASLDENSQAIRIVRAIATALVAAVIARLVLYPTGSLADLPGWARIGGLAAGFLAYFFGRRSVILGILVAEIVLLAGAWQGGLL